MQVIFNLNPADVPPISLFGRAWQFATSTFCSVHVPFSIQWMFLVCIVTCWEMFIFEPSTFSLLSQMRSAYEAEYVKDISSLPFLSEINCVYQTQIINCVQPSNELLFALDDLNFRSHVVWHSFLQFNNFIWNCKYYLWQKYYEIIIHKLWSTFTKRRSQRGCVIIHKEKKYRERSPWLIWKRSIIKRNLLLSNSYWQKYICFKLLYNSD